MRDLKSDAFEVFIPSSFIFLGLSVTGIWRERVERGMTDRNRSLNL